MDDRSIDLIIAATRAAPGAAKLQCSRFEDNAFGCVRTKRALGRDIESSVEVCKAADSGKHGDVGQWIAPFDAEFAHRLPADAAV